MRHHGSISSFVEAELSQDRNPRKYHDDDYDDSDESASDHPVKPKKVEKKPEKPPAKNLQKGNKNVNSGAKLEVD